jgi:glycogen operon protein
LIASWAVVHGVGAEVRARTTYSLGASYNESGATIRFRVFSSKASKIDLYLFDEPFGAAEKMVVTLDKPAGSALFSAEVPVAKIRGRGIGGTVYYGYRAWGPNWPFVASWTKGSADGFKADVDDEGNRFNPNKLLIDPYAAEISHDPVNPRNLDGSTYASGPDHRTQDSGPVAPKGIVLQPDFIDAGTHPTRPLREEIIYEVHLRGLTKLDSSIADADERGTYKGAAQRAEYLRSLGVTAVEFLPVHESNNDQNDVSPGPEGDNYWGYNTIAFFAPDRRYSSDKSPGGPTREFKRMVKAFHDRGLKVYLDVVFNHTGEGGLYQSGRPDTINILSFRGLDNRAYYELARGNRFYYDNTGVGGNFNAASPVVRDLILDSLTYWTRAMGVDGFRFDLAPILGNRLDHQRPTDGAGFLYDKIQAGNALNRAVRELPVRPPDGGPGVDLIAEPWTASGDGYQQGNFPAGWAEWNGRFRQRLRESQNQLGRAVVTPAELATRFVGSPDLFQDDGRKPWHSINFLVEHDGPCLRDLYAFTNEGWRAWDQNGDVTLQRRAARNGFAFPLLSIGTPMFTGGDEFYRTINGNGNPYNLDAPINYLNWDEIKNHPHHFEFARRVIAFRRAHPALRPKNYFRGIDYNGNGLKDITWYRDDAREPDVDYRNAQDRHFLAYRIDGTEFHDPAPSIYVAYNGWHDPSRITLPHPRYGRAWFLAGDTGHWMEPLDNFNEAGREDPIDGHVYEMEARSVLILIEQEDRAAGQVGEHGIHRPSSAGDRTTLLHVQARRRRMGESRKHTGPANQG